MNWQHLQTFLWLRWRVRINQIKRSSGANLVFFAIFTVAAFVAAISSFVFSLTAGRVLLAAASAPVLMLVWDGVVGVFLFFWLVGLMAELQRSELFSLDKFLHLPISLTGVFLINYIGSFQSLSLIVFVPATIGLSIALVLTKGPAMLLLFPLVAAFILMVTAVTYQFQGWLAALMVNKRRRRTVITIATLIFVLLVQLPNLLNIAGSRSGGNNRANREMREELKELDLALAAQRIDQSEYQREVARITDKYRVRRQEQNRERFESAVRVAGIANVVIPPGWLPYGARKLAEGSVLPPLLATLGMVLLAAASLWRSYRTTLRLYTGQFTSGKPSAAAAGSIPAPATTPRGSIAAAAASPALLERQLPWISEQASAIALSSFRSLTRAPEAKMLLLTPVIMVVVFGGMFFRRSSAPSEFALPFMAAGATAMVFLTMSQLAGNQFGFDRSGFRAFVLAGAPRKDVLLGKNLSLAPLALGLALAAVSFIEFVFPMRIDHLLATLVQMIPMYLVYCLVANALSTFAPMPMSSGSLKPARPKGLTILIHLAFFFLFPLSMAFTLFPLGLEFLLQWAGWGTAFPVYLVFVLAEAVAMVFLYDLVLQWQGTVLQSREQKILEVVTSKIE